MIAHARKGDLIVVVRLDRLRRMGEDETKVEPFVAKMGDKMNYRVALDDLASTPHGATHKAFMDAADRHSIPTAFIVDKDSKLAWVGHPNQLPPVLKQIAVGAFDARKTAADKAQLALVQSKTDARNFDGALKLIDELVAADPAMATKLGMSQLLVPGGRSWFSSLIAAACIVAPFLTLASDTCVVSPSRIIGYGTTVPGLSGPERTEPPVGQC